MLEHRTADGAVQLCLATIDQSCNQTALRDHYAALSKRSKLRANISPIEMQLQTLLYLLPNMQAAVPNQHSPYDGLNPARTTKLTGQHTAACIKSSEATSAWNRHNFWPNDIQRRSEHVLCTLNQAVDCKNCLYMRRVVRTAFYYKSEVQGFFICKAIMNPASRHQDMAALKDICQAIVYGAAEQHSDKHLRSPSNNCWKAAWTALKPEHLLESCLYVC